MNRPARVHKKLQNLIYLYSGLEVVYVNRTKRYSQELSRRSQHMLIIRNRNYSLYSYITRLFV